MLRWESEVVVVVDLEKMSSRAQVKKDLCGRGSKDAGVSVNEV
jgi:hypothetical protein